MEWKAWIRSHVDEFRKRMQAAEAPARRSLGCSRVEARPDLPSPAARIQPQAERRRPSSEWARLLQFRTGWFGLVLQGGRRLLYVFHLWNATFVCDLESERSGNPEWPYTIQSSFDAYGCLKTLAAYEEDLGLKSVVVLGLTLVGAATGAGGATGAGPATGGGAATGAFTATQAQGVSLRPVGKVALTSPARLPARMARNEEVGDSSEAKDEETFSTAECKAVDTAGESFHSSSSGIEDSASDDEKLPEKVIPTLATDYVPGPEPRRAIALVCSGRCFFLNSGEQL